jgi:hypothetical protein
MKLQYGRFKIVLTAETALRRATTISWFDHYSGRMARSSSAHVFELPRLSV